MARGNSGCNRTLFDCGKNAKCLLPHRWKDRDDPSHRTEIIPHVSFYEGIGIRRLRA